MTRGSLAEGAAGERLATPREYAQSPSSWYGSIYERQYHQGRRQTQAVIKAVIVLHSEPGNVHFCASIIDF